jgi:serine kinase of HPr protein (carbohydrate metabolism regulator)
MPRRRPAPTPQSPTITLHGVFMRVYGLGVLLTGASGVGKSELALELINREHQLVADDAADFELDSHNRIVGRCPPLLRGFLEARSLGILNIRRLYGAKALTASAPLDLVITLDAPGPSPDAGLERLTGRRSERELLGQRVPEISIPIRLGHNLAVLVEAACRDLKLRRRGYRADEDLTHRQLAAIHRATRPTRRPIRA